MENILKTRSILAVDCGSSTTTAILIERQGSAFQLQGTGQTPSTYGPPWDDITIGVQQAVKHIEQAVERTLLSPVGWPMTPHNAANQGVDVFTIVSSAGLPLKILVAGLMHDLSLASAHRIIATTYADITNILSVDNQSKGQDNSPEAKIATIQADNPEIILLVGGIDGGAERPVLEMAQVIATALNFWPDPKKPSVLYAGNSELRPQIADILGGLTALKSVDNIRPMLDVEDLAAAQLELEEIYLQQKMLPLPGFDKLSHWSKHPVLPASKSFEKLIAYLGQHNNLQVIGVNVGSGSTVISAQTKEHLSSLVCTNAGVGYNLNLLLKQVPLEQLQRWLPFDITLADLHNQLLNKTIYPATVPTTLQDLLIEHALAREAIRLTYQDVKKEVNNDQWNLIIGAGRTLTGTPHAAQAALIMLDALEPWGINSLALDKNGLVNLLGAIATIEAVAATQVAAQEAFLNLGTVIALAGHSQPGKWAVTVKLHLSDEQIIEQEVLYGDIKVIPLPPSQKAAIEIHPAKHFDIGLGRFGQGATAEVEGGTLGIIIDARGRPLRLPFDDETRQHQLQQWLSALNIPFPAAQPITTMIE